MNERDKQFLSTKQRRIESKKNQLFTYIESYLTKTGYDDKLFM